MNIVVCPYCRCIARLVTGDAIYPGVEKLHAKWYFLCRPCDAYVGCHPGTQDPLGVPARKNLRRARNDAHAAFDPMWSVPGRHMTRLEAYRWLADRLGIEIANCHIGRFDLETCRRVIEVCRDAVQPRVLGGQR